MHREWKDVNSYSNGIALIPGKVWLGTNKDKFFVFVDLDNKKAIDEICSCFGAERFERIIYTYYCRTA